MLLADICVDPSVRLLKNLVRQVRIVNCPSEDDGSDHGRPAPDRRAAGTGRTPVRKRLLNTCDLGAQSSAMTAFAAGVW